MAPLSSRLLGTSALLGLAAGAAWAAGRALGERVSLDEARNPRLINWHWARTVASAMARRGLDSLWTADVDHERAQRLYAGLVERSATLVATYAGSELPEPLTRVHVFDRAEWIDANLAQFQLLFAPLDEAYARAIARAQHGRSVGAAGQVMLSGQVGVLLGYLARRVLGQYDLSLLGREPVAGGRLYFVEPNVALMERQYALPPQEFRAWIALHEVTHAFELEAHPWVRRYLNDLLTGYLALVSDDLFGDRPGGALSVFAGRIKDNLFEHGHVLELMMSREQRDLFRRLQALMALMEGYSNHVMERVGAAHLPEHEKLKQTFESRARHRGAVEQLFIKLTGLDIKLEQYVLGERFCERVADARGIDFLNQVWEGPDRLPTLDEITDPDRWIERQAAVRLPST